MPHECDDCGETFKTLSRLRLHDCPATDAGTDDSLASFDSFLDPISTALEANMQQNIQDREKRGLAAASDDLKDSLEAAAQGDVDAALTMLANYERDLHNQYDAEDYDTYRGILWAFYEPAAGALDELAQREGWAFLTELIDAYPRESAADEPLVSPVIENAVGRSVIRTRLQEDLPTVPAEALAYLGSFWDSMGDVSAEESFTYGWGIGHPDHAVAEHIQNVITEELFWVRGTLPHAFYADQHAAADLLEALITTDTLDYEDRYILATILSEPTEEATTQIPRYWDWATDLNYQFQWDDPVKTRLRTTIEDEGFHQRLPTDWSFSDLEM